MNIWGRVSQVSPGDLQNCGDNSKWLFLATKLGDACYTAVDNRKAKMSSAPSPESASHSTPSTVVGYVSFLLHISKRLISSGQISLTSFTLRVLSSNLLQHLLPESTYLTVVGPRSVPPLECLLDGHHPCLPVPPLLRFFKIFFFFCGPFKSLY